MSFYLLLCLQLCPNVFLCRVHGSREEKTHCARQMVKAFVEGTLLVFCDKPSKNKQVMRRLRVLLFTCVLWLSIPMWCYPDSHVGLKAIGCCVANQQARVCADTHREDQTTRMYLNTHSSTAEPSFVSRLLICGGVFKGLKEEVSIVTNSHDYHRDL